MEESINPTINIGPITFEFNFDSLDFVVRVSDFCIYLLGKS